MTQAEALKRKIQIGQTAFNMYLAGNCQDEAIAGYAEQLGISVKSLKSTYITYYRNRPISPRPTATELLQYQNAQAAKLANAGKLGGEKRVQESQIIILLKMNYNQEVINYLKTTEDSLVNIYPKIREYINLHPENHEEIAKLKRIDEIIRKYRSAEAKRRATEENKADDGAKRLGILDTISKIIEEFLISETEGLETIIDHYREEISYRTFSNYLDDMQSGTVNQQFLYSQLLQKLARDNAAFEELAQKVISGISNGVEKNNRSCKFNILDYYRLTNLEPKKFRALARGLTRRRIISRRDFALIEDYFKALEWGNFDLTDQELSEMDYTVNNRSATSEEIQALKRYIISMPAPFNKNTYISAFEEYLNGYLDLGLARIKTS